MSGKTIARDETDLRLALPVAMVVISIAVGAASAALHLGDMMPKTLLGAVIATAFAVLVFLSVVPYRLNSRGLASMCLYASAVGLALPTARLTGWMTVTD